MLACFPVRKTEKEKKKGVEMAQGLTMGGDEYDVDMVFVYRNIQKRFE